MARAAELGFLPYFEPPELVALIKNLHLFKEDYFKQDEWIGNLLMKPFKGGEIILLEYEWEKFKGRGMSVQKTGHVIGFCSKSLALPYFELRPKRFFDRIGEAVGYEGISLPSQEDFSKRYYLRGTDENEIRLLFQPGLLRLLETSRDWYVGGAREWLLVARPGMERIKAKDLEKFIQEAMTLFEVMT